MPRLPSFAVKETPKGWRVRVPASISETGKDQARFFGNRREAQDFARGLRDDYRAHGEASRVLPPKVADDALRAWRLLEPFGLSIMDAALEVVEERKKLEGSKILKDAVSEWSRFNEFNRLRESTLKSYRLTMSLVEKVHGERLLAEITPQEFSESINGKSYALNRRNLSAMLRWSARPPRRWCEAERILEEIPIQRVRHDRDVSVLAPEEVEALLRSAENHYPEMVAVYAIGFFAGVRVEERKRMDFLSITEDGIEITSKIAKRRRRRFIPRTEALTAWLDRYPFARCSNFKEKDKAIRRLAGWDVSTRLLDKPPKPTRGKWPKNVIRHTHASVEIARGATLEDLLFRFGHTASAETLRSHYVGRYARSDAEKVLALRPAL